MRSKLSNFVLFQEPSLVKPYTVASEDLTDECESSSGESGKQICLMIKHYNDGAFTSKLKSLTIGEMSSNKIFNELQLNIN